MSTPVEEITKMLATEGGMGLEQDMANFEGEMSDEESGGMDEEEILSVIAAEMSQSATGTYSTEIDANREEALEYYLGNPRGDEIEGRSQIV